MMLTVSAFEGYEVSPTFTLSSRGPLVARTGRVTVIRGESGSGKSVLLQTLAGYRRARRGCPAIEAAVTPSPGAEPVPLRRFAAEPTRLSYLSQQSVLRPDLTPAQAVQDWCDLLAAAYGKDHAVRIGVAASRRTLQQTLFSPEEQAALGPGARIRVRDLSGGQQRRLDVLMTLCSPAELVLLDEPDTGLDATRRRLLFGALRQYAEKHARVLLMVSHYAGEEVPHAGAVDVWRARRHADGSGAAFSMPDPAPAPPQALRLHEPPAERGNRRLDQYLLYLRQRAAMLRRGRSAALLAAAAGLMALVRMALYPSPASDGPSLALLFFYAVTCFWLGAVQSTGFWAEEQTWFQRECRHGASTFSYLLGFVTATGLLVAAEAALGGLIVKYLSWSHLLTGRFDALGSDLRIGAGRIAWWGAWAGLNGVACGLLAGSAQHVARPSATSAATAQLLALGITLAVIVFSYPVIGERAYQDWIDHPASSDRLAVLAEAARQVGRREAPLAAIVAAESPIGASPSFHGLWFQGERPLRYGATGRTLDNAQKQAVPAALTNLLVLAVLAAATFRLAWTIKNAPTVP